MARLEPTAARVVRINAPDYFADPDVARALNDREMGLATWHGQGEPGEYSDVFLVVDQGECGDFDAIPEWIAEDVVRLVEEAGAEYAVVWLTNLGATLEL
jgi:hypothetical protein